ncbi:immunity protein Imm33 domain-containing protein [Mycobacterium hubeiense]|uniref:immunity protein Imm33 domain-containing protein n=1 Tax=Mycobacterium hubeiense TaxID=1867256 RepID=UPI000C7EE167|nr:DUF2185 domain-containing protein [Mycobacterium sp. QGD 101]
MANKKFRLSGERIVPGLAPEEGCLATDRITVDGSPAGYMFRDGWGWVFTAGDEDPTYLADRDHLSVLSVNVIANCDRSIVPYLQAPCGSAFIRQGDGFIEDPEGAPRVPDEPVPPTLNPEFPVVNGHHELTEDWVLTVPEPMNFRIDRGTTSSAVFWRPGLTAVLTPWGNPKNHAPAHRLQQVTAHVSPHGYDHAEWSANGAHYLTYRLAEGAGDERLPALYGFAVSNPGHVQLALYFDSGDDLVSAQSLVRSIKTQR